METTPEHMEQLTTLQNQCEQSAQDRESRHRQTPLYERLGGYENILKLTREIVRLHTINDDIKVMFNQVNGEELAIKVASFMSAGTGGSVEYKGKSMGDAHSHLDITDGDFLSAGGDIIKAMESFGYGQDEIEEVVCILLSMKDQVVRA